MWSAKEPKATDKFEPKAESKPAPKAEVKSELKSEAKLEAKSTPLTAATPASTAPETSEKLATVKSAADMKRPENKANASDGFKVRLMDVRQVDSPEEAAQLLKPRSAPAAAQSATTTLSPTPADPPEYVAATAKPATTSANKAANTSPDLFVQQAAPEEIQPNVSDPKITRGLRDTPNEPLPEGSPFEVIEEKGKLTVMVRRSKLLRTQVDVYRTAVVDDGVCEVVQFTPREVSIIGKSTGATHVTFWFEDANMKPLTYLVKVEPDTEEIRKLEQQYMVLEQMIAEMFPNSKIRLTVAANKLIVRGQARDSEEAAQIMSLIRSQQQGVSGRGLNGGNGSLNEGVAAAVLTDSAQGSGQRANLQIINMIRVPGVQQVALRVKIAELNRTSARNFGIDVGGNINVTNNSQGSQLFLNSLLNTANGATVPILGQFDGDDITVGLNYLQEHGVVKLLAEPTLVTMSGRPATFVAGGEFAVPTAVGVAGLNAVSTDFRAFGSIISFLPTIVDKDRIRLQVSPEFSQVNASLSVNNIPGLRTRTANTTVEMREGQTLAIAGLLEENLTGNTRGNLPFLARVFGKRSMARSETELIILVTPELVHPMEPEEVPPLPGFDVTEPTNSEFFLKGSLEGNPTREYRSTVWPRLHKRYGSGGPSMTSGPFGHGQ
jgi:pilus assembly protein CpaC